MNESISKKKTIVAILIILVVIAALMAVYMAFGPSTSKGTKKVNISVTNDKGSVSEYEVKTDAKFLKEAMEAAKGLTVTLDSSKTMVDSVNGLKAEYAADGAYWAFYVNGKYCDYGITEQPVNDGDLFEVVYMVGGGESEGYDTEELQTER